MAWLVYEEDDGGNLVDIHHYCEGCAPVDLLPTPCGIETDYPTYCEACGRPLGDGPLTAEGVEALREIWQGADDEGRRALEDAYYWIDLWLDFYGGEEE